MSLITCPDCKAEVSDKAKLCVSCGFPIREYVTGELEIEEDIVKTDKSEESDQSTDESKMPPSVEEHPKSSEPTEDSSEINSHTPTPSGKSNKKYVVHGIIGVVVLIVLLIVISNNSSKTKNSSTPSTISKNTPSATPTPSPVNEFPNVQYLSREGVNIREKPETESEKIILGDINLKLSTSNETKNSEEILWRKVKLESGEIGWVADSLLTNSPIAFNKIFYIKEDDVRIRAKPDLSSGVVSAGNLDDRIRASDINTVNDGYNWILVELPNNKVGWMADIFLKQESEENLNVKKQTPISKPTNKNLSNSSPDLQTDMTVSQKNAVRTAKSYIKMQGFSRAGLINQLSSEYGSGYNIADATLAVDSMNIDWNRQAVRSANSYLKIMGFSCNKLIEQLSSSYGSKYTESQATYGARQAGACN